MRSPSADEAGPERGSITAEFAVTLPAVLVMLVACLAGVQLAGLQLRVQDAASVAVRAVSRGGSVADSPAARLVPGVSLSAQSRGDLACVEASIQAPGMFAAITLRANSCALGGG